MRGGTSKGVFFRREDLPSDPAARDRILLRVIGSPDPYGKQIDGMGGATSSTSKVVLLARSDRDDCDVDYLFGQVAIDRALIDWSGNCGNLTAAVGPFAVSEGLVEAPRDGIACVRIWQANLGKRIVSHVPMRDGLVVEEGDFELDGVTFPAAEVRLEFLEPGASEDGEGGAMFPTGRLVHDPGPGAGGIGATLVNEAVRLRRGGGIGLAGDELRGAVNANGARALRAIRAHGAVAMGLASVPRKLQKRPHTPKLCFVTRTYVASAASAWKPATSSPRASFRWVAAPRHDPAPSRSRSPRLFPERSCPSRAAERAGACSLRPSFRCYIDGGRRSPQHEGGSVTRAVMSRSARRLMEGWVRIPKT
jgi:2-methylaconitate cis-trans-isomerase PrpF